MNKEIRAAMENIQADARLFSGSRSHETAGENCSRKDGRAMKAAIFDLDGTLVDSMGVWDQVCRDFLIQRNIPVPPGIGAEIKKMSFAESAACFIERFALKETVEQLIGIWNAMAGRAYAEQVELKSGVREFLSRLRENGVKMGITTATDRELAEAVLKRHGIFRFFRTIVTVGEAGRGKEHPDIFLLAARRLNTEPWDCVVFEDSLHAVKGAKKAGMRVWGVFDAFSAHEQEEIRSLADGYVRSFAELLADNGPLLR